MHARTCMYRKTQINQPQIQLDITNPQPFWQYPSEGKCATMQVTLMLEQECTEYQPFQQTN